MMQLCKQLIHLARPFWFLPGTRVNSNCPVFMRFKGPFGSLFKKTINSNSHNLLRIYYILDTGGSLLLFILALLL